MEPNTELTLIKQVGEWSEKNFGEQRYPELGIVEEIGEMTHCILKRLQGIRGFDNPKQFNEAYADALADTVIYLADWCSLHNAFFQFDRAEVNAKPHQPIIMQHLLSATGSLFADYAAPNFPSGATNPIYSSIAQRIIQGLVFMARAEDLDLRLITASTWAKVSKRDWKRNPINADQG